MHHPFVPAMLLLFAPALFLAWCSGRLKRPPVQAGLVLIAGAIVLWSIAYGGMDFDHLKRIKMLLASATAALLAARAAGAMTSRRTRVVALGGIAAASWLVHFNFLAFHGSGGTREFVHLHDVAHYYLGSKYFREIAHADLYTAMLRAEADRFGPRAVTGQVRNLRDNSLADARAVLRDSDVVKSGFTPTRWQALQDDVAYFRATMGNQYRKILVDFGYNPTPLWTVLGGSLANLVPAGSNAGIRALTLIDPLLELVMFAAIAWAFGIEIALISMIYFCLLFGASFGWLGGAVLRHLWLATLIGSACLLRKRRYAGAGALLAVSTLLRVFPIFFALGPLAAMLQQWRRGQTPRNLIHFAGGLVITAAILLAATSINPRGLESWLYFQANMQRHVQNIAFNTIGLTHLVQPLLDLLPFRSASGIDKSFIHQVQLVTVLPLSLLWLFRRAGRGRDFEAMALGFVPIFVALDLACYYYVAFLLMVLVCRDSPLHLATLFAADTVSYITRLFEDHDATIFLYRNATVATLLIFLSVYPPEPARSAVPELDA